MNESPHDAVGAYVLDALSEEERDSFEEHLAACEACRAEVADLRAVVDVLPLACDPVEPSPGLRDRLLAAIDEESGRPPDLVALPGGRAAPRERNPWRFPEIVGLAAAAVLIVGLGLWNVHLQRQIDSDHQALAYQQQVAQAIASHATVSALSATDASGASAALVQPRGRRPAYLIVEGLRPTPASRVYELWLIHLGAKPRPAAVFSYGGTGPKIVPLPMAARGYSIAAVTVEPGWRPAPTGAKVLAGTLQA